jgi:Ni/Fe-hydrogenase 1 B-type cytochrome subunit
MHIFEVEWRHVIRNLERQYVYGVAQRVLHWWLALSTFGLIATGLIASNMEPDSTRAFVWGLHMICGKVFAVGFVGRVVWGIIGPKHARFSALFYPKAWIESIKSKKMLSADRAFGHHEQASISYIGYYVMCFFMIATGFTLAGSLHGEGPLANKILDDFTNSHLIHEIHEYIWWAIGFFIVTHVGALIFHEWHDNIPLSQSMISGFQYRSVKKENDLEKS